MTTTATASAKYGWTLCSSVRPSFVVRRPLARIHWWNSIAAQQHSIRHRSAHTLLPIGVYSVRGWLWTINTDNSFPPHVFRVGYILCASFLQLPLSKIMIQHGLTKYIAVNVCNPTKIHIFWVLYICKSGTWPNAQPKHRMNGIIMMAAILMAST